MKTEEMNDSEMEGAMAARYRIADDLAAVAMMVMIVVAAGLGTVIFGG